MTLTEIKKELYKQDRKAYFFLAKKGRLMYSTDLYEPGRHPDDPIDESKFINIVFEIPFDDMGDAEFEEEMPAKLLIRYIVMPETTTP